MNPDNNAKKVQIKRTIPMIAILVLLAGLLGWWIGRSDEAPPSNQTTSSHSNTSANSPSDIKLKSLISYSLPGGWKENSCPGKDDIYIAPENTSVNCDMEPRSPIVMTLDSEGATDCNQLQNVQNVSKHICISEFINGHKSLKAETVYNKDSTYNKEATINAYYIDTGKSVVKVEYIHDPQDSDYLSGFERLAKSVKSKG